MTTQSGQNVRGAILVGDDDPTTRTLLRHLLETDGFVVEDAEDGLGVLEKYTTFQPDLVLLDAVMPEPDGFEVCQRLQQMPGGDRVPILIITALEDEASIERAFEIGAVDYVTKPVYWPVLRQRVKRLVESHHLEKMRDDLIQMIVHDMKNPISTIRGYAEVLLADPPQDAEMPDALTRIYHSSNNLLNMTMMILDIGRLEEGKMILEPVEGNLCSLLAEVKDSFEWMAQNYRVHIELAECDQSLRLTMDWPLIQRILANLVSNAIKHSQPEGRVWIASTYDPGLSSTLRLSVQDEGEGISEQDQKRIFDKFTQAAGRKKGSRIDTGLGLTFCKLAIQGQGATIYLQIT